jgi:anthranilate phosphoribosyltransferase
MSQEFRELLKKIGSGPHTGENLTREEAAIATELMLTEKATPAQIGGFMIAHRIKRPTGAELAGMLDSYTAFGPKLKPTFPEQKPIVLGIAYDGRNRTFPINPMTVLILLTAGQSVILHGGDRMPTKYGVPLIEIWQNLGLDFRQFDLNKTQQFFAATGLGFIYLPQHFPQANKIVQYRDEIGKRPPFATMELIWSPYQGETHIMAGFVHPPTEKMFTDAIAIRGKSQKLTTIKGLEGSPDLPRDRTAIIGLFDQIGMMERLHLHHYDYGISNYNPVIETAENIALQIQELLQGKDSELFNSAVWNGGFYLWRNGICADMETGINRVKEMLKNGKVREKLQQLKDIYG